MPEGQMMRIGELAAHIDASPRVLRHYEDQGLLASTRGQNGYRFYDRDAVTRATNVKTLLDVGLTAEDVRQHAESGCLDEPLDEVPHCNGELAPIEARLHTLNELIARLEAVRERLSEHARSVEASLNHTDRD
ncbi:MerR family transcriptional regulator [Brachybacterium sacelli]|uniref:DNA-binding transcriptional MerR regulator n=1 Tax=Brachybacterium sacelli TaxID=173364 RepID=A0ABS4X1Y4_9MICO|nr:MerR family transcriptional regulator [Brachybacterium sacelli]MBP2382476.1 DNA-binding transcriptional MerR regulator [Brachybacterium sacelli]